MNRRLMLLLVLMAMLLLASAALAQSTIPMTDVDAPLTAFVTIDLAAGYPLEPLIVSLNGGGDVAASTYGEECTGFIPENPTDTLNWAGEAAFVEAFFFVRQICFAMPHRKTQAINQGLSHITVDFRQYGGPGYIHVFWDYVKPDPSAPIYVPAQPSALPPVSSVNSLATQYGDYTLCIRQSLHQANCFQSNG